jgi:ionotropic glutamate receptor
MEWSLRHCSRPSPSLALALLLLHVLRGGVPLPVAAAPGVRVGVVLDLTSDVGRKSLACISMALDDFYGAARASSSRRVVLRVRDSSGDVVTAAHAGKSATT